MDRLRAADVDEDAVQLVPLVNLGDLRGRRLGVELVICAPRRLTKSGLAARNEFMATPKSPVQISEASLSRSPSTIRLKTPSTELELIGECNLSMISSCSATTFLRSSSSMPSYGSVDDGSPPPILLTFLREKSVRFRAAAGCCIASQKSCATKPPRSVVLVIVTAGLGNTLRKPRLSLPKFHPHPPNTYQRP